MGPKKNPKNRPKSGKAAKVVIEYEPADPCEVVKTLEESHPKPSDKNQEVDEKTKESFTIQISNCYERLLGFQRRADELVVNVGFYTDLFKQLEEDRKDLSSYLESCVKNKEDELIKRRESFEAIKSQGQTETDEYRLQFEELTAQIKEMKENLTAKNQELVKKLNAMKPVEEEMLEIIGDTKDLEHRLHEKRFLSREGLYERERNFNMNVEQLRRTAEQRLSEVAAVCMRLASSELKTTVKRSVVESVIANRSLADRYSEDFISDLLTLNTSLSHRTEESQRSIDILQVNWLKMIRKARKLGTEAKLLVDKVKAQFQSFHLDYEQTNEELRGQILTLRKMVGDQKLQNLKEKERNKNMKAKRNKLHDNIKQATIINQDLYEVLKAATPGLKQILTKSHSELLEKLENLSNEEFPMPTKPEKDRCPHRSKAARLLYGSALQRKREDA